MQIFNTGDYLKAVEQKIASETISKVLYPSDAVPPGQELRLLQEYFLVACVVSHVVSQGRSRSSTRMRISSATASAGCVSFSWTATFAGKVSNVW